MLKGPQWLAVEPLIMEAEHRPVLPRDPEMESVNGLFIQAGVDARTGLVSGAGISRSWT